MNKQRSHPWPALLTVRSLLLFFSLFSFAACRSGWSNWCRGFNLLSGTTALSDLLPHSIVLLAPLPQVP